MKLTRLAIGLICLFAFSICVHSQTLTLNSDNLSGIKIDNISDTELKSYYQQAVSSGLSDDQIFRLASDKGLPPIELDKLKTRVSNFGQTATTAGVIKTNKPAERSANPDAAAVPMETFAKNNSIYGSELFSANSTVFEPNLRIATPSNYILGPDDEIVINVFGFSEQTYTLTVNQEGNIYIPNVGPIYVNGLSMDQASTKIKNKLASTIYKAINSGGTKVQITLGKIRSIRVTVIGEARKPGTYTVSSLTTLFNLLYLCGGPSEMGSFRNIELIRGNQLKKKVDIYNFLTRGDLKDNVLLEELDVIRIPFYENRVTLQGEVKRQGIFELQNGETLNQLFAYAGGFTDNAYRASVNLVRITEKDRKLSDVPLAQFDSFKPAGSDVVTVGRLSDQYSNRVNIGGAVFRPGAYELVSGMNLKDLIEKAGGIREDAYLQRGLITRENPDRSPVVLAFNISDVINGRETVLLKKEDVIFIGALADMKDKYSVTIEGDVHKPGSFQWKENLSLKDLVFIAGGFTESANELNVEVSRRIKDALVGQSQYKQADVFRVDLKNGMSVKDKDFILQPFDIVSVRTLPGYVQQRSVLVNGEIMNGGKYILSTNNEKLTDLISRFGGFRNAADSNSITLKRMISNGLSTEEKKDILQRVMSISEDSLNNNATLRNTLYKNYDIISINLEDAIRHPEGASNLLLEDGDVISVNRSSSLVKVSGEVYYPTMIPHKDGASLKYYLQQAGSFTENARKNSSMVIYPNGHVNTVRKFLFFKHYPAVMARSEIFVPAKSKTNRSRLTTGEWVAISSIFATLATLFITAFR